MYWYLFFFKYLYQCALFCTAFTVPYTYIIRLEKGLHGYRKERELNEDRPPLLRGCGLNCLSRRHSGKMNTTAETLREYLEREAPEYLAKVADHWLDQSAPIPWVQYILAVVFFLICVPSQICQFLVIMAFCR